MLLGEEKGAGGAVPGVAPGVQAGGQGGRADPTSPLSPQESFVSPIGSPGAPSESGLGSQASPFPPSSLEGPGATPASQSSEGSSGSALSGYTETTDGGSEKPDGGSARPRRPSVRRSVSWGQEHVISAPAADDVSGSNRRRPSLAMAHVCVCVWVCVYLCVSPQGWLFGGQRGWVIA
jgi:hypothetical protein